MTDAYEFAKSEKPQNLDKETPYSDKQWNYINDINSGVYTNSQQSLVQFDLSTIYNSGAFIDVSQMYITIPLIYTACYSTGSGPIPPTAGDGNEFLITPKSGSWNLIQSIEVQVNGKTVIQQQPNINFYTNFKMLSQMSKDDLTLLGRTLGFYPDDVQSYLYNGTASALSTSVGPVGGNGLSNNMIFPITSAGVNAQGYANKDQMSGFTNFGTPGYVYNSSLQYRSQRIAQNTGALGGAGVTGANNMIGNNANYINTQTQLNNEFRPYYCVANTNYMTWFDVAVIRLCDICDFFAQGPLLKNFDGLLRVYVNSGSLLIGLSEATTGGMYLTSSNSTFVNTCPFIINQMPVANLPANTANLAVSVNIAKSTVSQSYAGVVLANSATSHSMNACRVYYPMIQLKPDKGPVYSENNREKIIVYCNVLSSTYTNISSGSTFNQLVQSGVRNLKGVLIIPFVSQATHGNLANTTGGGNTFATPIIPFAPYSSPFDTAPCTTPMSITQLNVAVGGKNELMNFYNYTYENFLQQVGMYEKVNGNDLGLSCGLISQYMWENGYRYYYVDCSRGDLGDQNSPKNVTITFLNNTLQSMDVWVFVEYFVENQLDVELGKIL